MISQEKIAEVRQCAASWDPESRLLGNVTAAEIIAICDQAARLRYCELSRKGAMEENSRLQETCSVLLEAVREGIDYVYNVPPTDCAQGGCPIDDPNQWREELYRKMIAALRKAEGRE